MMIEFTSEKAIWTIKQRQSVRFMIIVTDPLNVSTREVIKVSREVTEATPLICASQAPLEMVLMKPLKPTPKKKPTTSPGRTLKSSNRKNDKGDIAKGTESQIDDVDKIERDKASEAKNDAVAENKNGAVLQECDSKANVNNWTEASTAPRPLIEGSLSRAGSPAPLQARKSAFC